MGLQVKDEPTDEGDAKRDNLLEVTRKLKRKAGRMIEELRSLRRTSLVQRCGLFLICLLLNDVEAELAGLIESIKEKDGKKGLLLTVT